MHIPRNTRCIYHEIDHDYASNASLSYGLRIGRQSLLDWLWRDIEPRIRKRRQRFWSGRARWLRPGRRTSCDETDQKNK